MNKEDYVSFEVAKLLKEKGNNSISGSFYDKKGKVAIMSPPAQQHMLKLGYLEDAYPRPTLYEAQKWLRDTMCLHIEIGYMYGDYWLYDILTIPTHDLIGLSDRENVRYKTYEEALNAGILEALKLI